MKENKRKESDRRHTIKPVVDEKRNSLLQKDRSNSLTNSTNRYNPLDNRIHHNGNHNPGVSESLCYETCCGAKQKYLICIIVTVFSVLLAITAVTITLTLFVYNEGGDLLKQCQNEEVLNPQEECFQLCQPVNYSQGIRERMAVKQWIPEGRSSLGTDGSHCPLGIIGRNGSVKTYTIFPYPAEEPKYSSSDVGDELMLSPLIQAGRFEEVRNMSKVNAAAIGTDVLSYSGFITIQNLWKSHLFFWFFPASPDNDDMEMDS